MCVFGALLAVEVYLRLTCTNNAAWLDTSCIVCTRQLQIHLNHKYTSTASNVISLYSKVIGVFWATAIDRKTTCSVNAVGINF